MAHATSRPRLRFLALLLILLPAVAIAGCDSVTGDDDENGGSIIGTWQEADGSEFVVITADSVTVYSGDGASCFDLLRFEIVGSTGNEYNLQLAFSTLTLDIIIERSGDDLEIRPAGSGGSVGSTYSSSTRDVSELEVCTGGAANATPACSELPPIALGETISGNLTTADRVAPEGQLFDVYGLTLTSTRQVQIDLSSNEVDSYLWVYDADGDLIAGNDDANAATLDSSLFLQLDPGCYRVEASSFEPDETGAYTLSVS